MLQLSLFSNMYVAVKGTWSFSCHIYLLSVVLLTATNGTTSTMV